MLAVGLIGLVNFAAKISEMWDTKMKALLYLGEICFNPNAEGGTYGARNGCYFSTNMVLLRS